MKINELTGLYENYGLWHVPFWQTRSFDLAIKGIGVFLLVVVVGLLAYRYKHRKKKVSPWECALLRLKTMQHAQETQAYSAKEFYAHLTSIIKNYLYQRFGYDVVGKTDDEVICYLSQKKLDPLVLQEIIAVFRGVSIIKFANASAEQEQMRQDCHRCFCIIKQTIPCKK
jgi:hypothetical protein